MNPLMAEKLVEILAAAVDLGGEPCDAASLSRKLGLDEFAKMKISAVDMFFCFHTFSDSVFRPCPKSNRKSVKLFALPSAVVINLDYHRIKVNTKSPRLA